MGKETTKQGEPACGMSGGDAVITSEGAGVIVREVRNLYLMRPGKMFEIELDAGGMITAHENELIDARNRAEA